MTHIQGQVFLLQTPGTGWPVVTAGGLGFALTAHPPLAYIAMSARDITPPHAILNSDGQFDAGDIDIGFSPSANLPKIGGHVTLSLVIDGHTYEAPVPPTPPLDPTALVPITFPQAFPVTVLHDVMLQQQQAKYRWGDANPNRPGYCGSSHIYIDTDAARYQAVREVADRPAQQNKLFMAINPPIEPLTEADYDKLNGDPSFMNLPHKPSFRNAGNPRGSTARNNDAAFAAQRVAGINPLVIVRAGNKTPALSTPPFAPPPPPPQKGGGRPLGGGNSGVDPIKKHPDPIGGELPGHLPWLGPKPWRMRFQEAFGLSVDDAIHAERLYVCDYTPLLGGVTAVPAKSGPSRTFVAPIAVFLQQPTGLAPAGIFLGGDLNLTTNPVFMPGDANWEVAKLAVQSADLNAHEMKSHLHDTHLVMEAMAVAMYRNLWLTHPVARLLHEHFHTMLHQGWFARTFLMNPTGGFEELVGTGIVDAALGTGIGGAWKIVENAHGLWRFSAAGLEADLAARNMAQAPIAYPYRDDARDVLTAISGYVERYVDAAYPTAGSVGADAALHAWIAEASDPQKGNLAGLSAPTDNPSLSALISQIIFTCTAQHSAVNYPQYDYFGRVTNMPAALWNDPHLDASGHGPSFLSLLPNKVHAVDQIDLSFQLSQLQFDKIGDYKPVFSDLFGLLIDDLRKALQTAQDAIKARNDARRAQSPALDYPYLLPSLILQSISI